MHKFSLTIYTLNGYKQHLQQHNTFTHAIQFNFIRKTQAKQSNNNTCIMHKFSLTIYTLNCFKQLRITELRLLLSARN